MITNVISVATSTTRVKVATTMDHTVPSTKVFSALLAGNIRQLHSCSSAELRPFLPCLSRIVLCPPATATMSDSTTSEWENSRTIIHTLIAGMQDVNAIREYLSLSFRELKQDAQKEQQLLRKLGPGEERAVSQSVLASSLQFGLAIEFERSDYMRRFRLLLSEILRIVSQVCVQHTSSPFFFFSSVRMYKASGWMSGCG